MARTDLLTTNFTGGELAPRLYGRPDLAKYNDAAKRLRDVVVLKQGGATARPGTDYLGEVKDSARRTRLVPFVRDVSNAFALEFGHLTMRVWKDGALVESTPGTPYEIAQPYTETEVWDVDFTQGADTMLLAHPGFAIRRLRRFSDTRWVLDVAPFDPAPFDEIGERFATSVTLGATTGSTTATASGSTWLASDVGRTIQHNGGEATITGYTSATVVNVTVTSAFASVSLPATEWVLSGSPQTTCTPTDKDPVGKVTTLTLAADGWRSNAVGKFVALNGGLLEVTAYTSATQVSARIVTVLTATVAAEANSWSLEGAVWNQYDGYPATVTFHEQRTVAGSTSKYPQSLWGSKPGLYFDFTKGTTDDAAYTYELGTDEINPIRFLSSTRSLVALTYGGEWTVSGGVEKPITPTSVRAIMQNRAGSAAVRPEQIDDDLFYAQRGGDVLRSIGYRIELGGFVSDDVSSNSDHIIGRGVEELSFAQAPERVLWIRLSDGTYSAATISRAQELRPFTLCTPGGGGVLESMATIPEGDEDATYVVVRRTISGTTKRYLERMRWDARMDCLVEKAPASATVTGLGHLEGKTVGVLADGVDIGDYTVTGGQVVLTRVAAAAVVGLRFTPTIKLLTPETGTGMGVSIGGKTSASSVRVLFHETVGCNVDGKPLAWRNFGEEVLDSPIGQRSGWTDVSRLGWSADSGEIELTQPQAYPWTVLAVVRRMTANPG